MYSRLAGYSINPKINRDGYRLSQYLGLYKKEKSGSLFNPNNYK